jgi:hypothetical protein
MTVLACIDHPKDKRELHWKAAPAKFLAYGRALPTIKNVTGRLLDVQDQLVQNVPVTQLQPPTGPGGFWMLLFTNVPLTDHTRPYRLLLLNDDDPNAPPLASSKLLTVRMIPGFFDILYPEDNDQLCNTFSAYGPIDEPGTPACQLTGPATVDADNVQVSMQVWVASFLSVQTPGTYKLNVTLSGVTKSSSNLDVQNRWCSSIG